MQDFSVYKEPDFLIEFLQTKTKATGTLSQDAIEPNPLAREKIF